MKVMRIMNIRNGPMQYSVSNFVLMIMAVLLSATSCITPFEPEFKGVNNLLVIDGSLIKGFPTQEIRISRSTSVTEPSLQNVEGCSVSIMDDSGNEFIFAEESPGKYVAGIDDALLDYSRHYKLIVSTPSGDNYESAWQAIPVTAPVDSIYSIKETRYFSEEDEYLQGLQFYVDLDAPDDASRYYRWQVVETWELHASHKINGVFDGKTIYFDQYNPSDSLYYCWDSRTEEGIYTYSTVNLSHNRLRQFPLHFKAYNSPELTIKYSATVRQFALDEDAWYYWNHKETELKESGQFYTTQPAQLRSNIHNTLNPDEKVLGYFWVSAVTEKHMFEKNPFYNNVAIGPSSCTSYGTCAEFIDEDLINTLYHITHSTWHFPLPPVYMYFVRNPVGMACIYFSTDECIDCRRIAGTNHKPDFWE
jgi:hypothetical protein